MYEAHWKLDHRPFEQVTGTGFYYPAEVHQGALLKLRYTIENRRGAAVLAGAAGLGKTLLVDELFHQLATEYSPKIHIVFPQMPAPQLISFISDELCGPAAHVERSSVDLHVRRIRDFLAQNTHDQRHAVIAIDEAQLLENRESLEMIRLLLNFQTDGQPDMTLLLVGQSHLLLNLDRLSGLEERFTVKSLLRSLTVDETLSYVSHRLTAAGASHNIFTPDALESIHELSFGVPRRINRLCDLALLIGYAEGQLTIETEHISSVAEEMVTVIPE